LQVTQGDFEVVTQHGGCATRMLPAVGDVSYSLLRAFEGRLNVRS
jgi:hypothetical protein